ncbi:MAG: stage III sporulation protein AD [Desulfotomaculales bacterium]
MEIVQIVGLALVAAVLVVVLRPLRPELALLLSVAAGVVLFLLVVDKVAAVVGVMQELAGRAGVNALYLGLILKIVGIAYIAEFGAQVCRDAGEGALAAKVELAGKVLVLVLAVPVLVAVLDTLLALLP